MTTTRKTSALIAVAVVAALLVIALVLWLSGFLGGSARARAGQAQLANGWVAGPSTSWGAEPELGSQGYVGQIVTSPDVVVVLNPAGPSTAYDVGTQQATPKWTATFEAQGNGTMSGVILGDLLLVDGEPFDLKTGKPASVAPVTASAVAGQGVFGDVYGLCTAEKHCSFYDRELKLLWDIDVNDFSGILRSVVSEGKRYVLYSTGNAWWAADVRTGEAKTLPVPPEAELSSTVRDGWSFSLGDTVVLAGPDGTRIPGVIDWDTGQEARFAFTPGAGSSTIADVAYVYFGDTADARDDQIRGTLNRESCVLTLDSGTVAMIQPGPVGCFLWGESTSPNGGVMLAEGGSGSALVDLKSGAVHDLVPSYGSMVRPDLYVAWDYDLGLLSGLVPHR